MNIFMVLALLFWTTSAYAWRCGQDCPSSWLSGRAECLAHNAACNPIPSPPVPTGRDNVGSLVCIFNATNVPIPYVFRWGNYAPEQRLVYPNNGQIHWWPYQAVNQNNSPSASVEYDWVPPQQGTQQKVYNVRSWPQSDKNCNKQGVTEEVFQPTNGGQTIEMFNRRK